MKLPNFSVSVGRGACLFFAMITAALLMFVLAGCGDNDKSGGGGFSDDPVDSTDTRLVNAVDEAWVNELGMGYIFKADMTYQAILEYDDVWVESGTGTWDTSGDLLVLNNIGQPYAISADGDALTLSGIAYTRQYVEVVENDGGLDTRLVNALGEAWVDDWPAGERLGFVFLPDGRYMWIIDDFVDGSGDVFWVVLETGTWYTDNGVLSLTDDGGAVLEDSYTVSVNGNTLTVFDYTLTRTEVGEITDPDIGFDSRLVTGSDKAWVYTWGDGDRDGYILLEDGTGINIDDWYAGSSGDWAVYSVGTWFTIGNVLVFDYFGDGGSVDIYLYTIRDDILIWGGHEHILTDVDVGELSMSAAKSRGGVGPFQKKLSKPGARSGSASPARFRRDRGNSW